MRIPPKIGVPLAVVLLVLAAWRIVSSRGRPPTPQVPALCEACKHEFTPKPGESVPSCPSCGRKVNIRLLYFRCKLCGETFVAYEYDPVENLTRKPGGPWIPPQGYSPMPSCPECGSEKLYSVRNPDTPPTDSRKKR